LDEPTAIKINEQDGLWFWVDITIAEHTLRIGFPQNRIGPRPPFAALLLLIGGTAIILITTLLLVRRTTRPLAQLVQATTRFGKGENIEPLQERGPQEIASLTRSFNRMMQHIHELLTNRTTLLAGVSHDLRTPIARMRLAIEMLQSEPDPLLVEGLRHDLMEMDQLIKRVLDTARGLDEVQSETEIIDLVDFVDGIIADYQNNPQSIEWVPGPTCTLRVSVTSLQRVLINLIDNALRYGGENGKVNVSLKCDEKKATIRILDQGPGIPADQRQAVFQPFHRLETSRSKATGGSGLGLAIVQQLCDAHGWKIQLLPGETGGTEARLQIMERGISGQ
jgi:two-component system osmolarity sensor histidine kinase EnvZ